MKDCYKAFRVELPIWRPFLLFCHGSVLLNQPRSAQGETRASKTSSRRYEGHHVGPIFPVLFWVCRHLFIVHIFVILVFVFRYLAWSCDAIDFFSVSLSVTHLQAQFGKTANQIVRSVFYPCQCCDDHLRQTTAITLTLLFRSVGAVSANIRTTCFTN